MSTETPAGAAETQAQGQGGCCGSNPSGCSSHGAAQQPAPSPFVQLEEPAAPATDPAAASAVVQLTEKAATEVKRYIAEKNVDESYVLRVILQGGGCSGFSYKLGFDERTTETDVVSEQYGVRVAVDQKFVMFMQGTILDYIDGIDKRGFDFRNPNATSTCGCGSSFSV